jgi:DNA-binding NarL/FixJ family response regulator
VVTRIAIVAPALALRAGLRALLEAQAWLEIAYEAASLAGFAGVADEIDVLLITAESLSIPVLRQALPEEDGRLGVLLISNQARNAHGLADLPLRAWGILPVEASAEELTAALQAIGQGLLAGTAALLGQALAHSPLAMLQEMQSEAALPDQQVSPNPLTERESQILQWVARGLANKQIAAALSISEHTVKFHVSSIYAKLGVASRTEAVRSGVQRGLITL